MENNIQDNKMTIALFLLFNLPLNIPRRIVIGNARNKFSSDGSDKKS